MYKLELINIAKRMGIEESTDMPRKDLAKLIKSVEFQRSQFAASALTGLLANEKYFNPDMKDKMIREDLIFDRAFEMADGMIKAGNLLNL
ncbi:MAG: hypothetical protein GY928_02255 [Colwellia sp.]|nr:hypothetical protein [Colwellia sp.]